MDSAAGQHVEEISTKNIKSIIDSVDTILLDCDGVIWNENEIISGTPDTINWLKSLNKRIFYISNNSTKSRDEYRKKLKDFNITCEKEDVWCSSFVSASYLKSIDFKKKVYLIGMSGIAAELEEANIPYRGFEEHNVELSSFTEASKYEIDEEIGAVIVGMDLHIRYAKVAFAQLHLRDRNECLFIATNDDHVIPVDGGRLLPGSGSIARMIECCSDRIPFVLGKPNTWLLQQMIKMYKLDRGRMLMVGDNLKTDILFGNNESVRTLLVETGVSKRKHIYNNAQNEQKIIPTYVSVSLSHLMEAYKESISSVAK
ncbi:uncharacterized protein LOC126329924 [Schistocerca gregaria]|uniref:uncharacterized protein LOC126329924 n=1 Tax=Schistocerca gregaria TaxID=7010 RepID=UPI00211E0766|nr:uncharacterized protein LOC126329924 [Schistocerca gregaria]